MIAVWRSSKTPIILKHKKLFSLNGYRDAQHPDIVKRHAQIIGVYPRPMPPL